MIKYDFTFKEFLDSLTSSPTNKAWDMAESFKATFYDDYTSAPLWTSTSPVAAKPFIEDFWKLLFARFSEWNCLEEDESYLSQGIHPRKFTDPFINILVMTYDKYAILIKGLDDIRAKLLAQVESSTETGYNDTPQDEGAFTDATHKTSYTKVTSLTDGATPIERLDEVHKKIKNLYLEWTDEFKRLFWED